MTKMIRLPVGGDQEQSPPDLTSGNGIQSENICTEIPSLRESAPKSAIKMQESSAITAPAEVDLVEQDLQNQRRTSHRLLTANRNDAIGTTSTISSTRSVSDQGNMRSSEQRISSTSDPSSTATSIICSLPLNRLESILGMLSGLKKSPSHTADLVTANAVSRDQEQNNSSPAGSDSTYDAPNDNNLVFKVLCLYCDRSFTNQKLMIKHTDRIHRIAKDRRSSTRVLSTALNGSDVSSCCHFCHKSKTLNLMSENLPELFQHLISVHSDRYYACEYCTIRFPSDEAREAHMEALHPSTNSGRPKSKAALKAFSHGQNSCTLHHPQPVVSVVNCKTFKTSGVSRSEATEPLLTLDLCSTSMDRLVVNNNSVNNSSTKGESVQNICLRSSLRNATSQAVEKDPTNGKPKTKAFKKSERLLRRNSEPMLLSRLGITQHRLPRQSRRLLAAASTTANASLLSSETSSASSISSTSSAMGTCIGKLTTKKKSLILASDEVQPVQNCYNKITKLKTIRSTLSTNSMMSIADSTNIETTDSGKVLDKAPECTTNGGATVTSAGPTSETVGGFINRGTMNNNSLTGNSIWCNSAGSISINASNGSTAMLATNNGLFDEDFYETVTQNVKNNLSCHLDGKLEASTPYAPSPMSPVSVVPAVRSTVVKSPVTTDRKIHEATNLPTLSVMFPTLLTVEQYGTDLKPTTSTAMLASVSSVSSAKTKKTVTKNSWKWKWDFVKKYKYVNENGRIVKKIKQPTIGLRDLSKLDMWTQLTMRTKHELFQHRRSNDDQRQVQASSATQSDPFAKDEPMIIAEAGATLRHEKRAMVEQLDHILDARLLPHIDLEQNDQRIIKLEPSDEHVTKEETPSNLSAEPIDDKAEINVTPTQCSTLVPWSNHPNTQSNNMEFLHNLQLIQLNRHHKNAPVVLSGEWARPRCYICYGCGAKFNSLKQVEEHRIFRHPHVHSTFYEIVGRELIEKRLYKHFFIPVIALMMQQMHCMRSGNPERIMNSAIMHGMIPQHAGVCRINTVTEIKNEDSSSNEATSFSTSTSASSSSSSSSSRHSTNTTVTTLMDTCSDTINVLTQCSALAIDDEDVGNSVRSVICSKCQKECQNEILLYAHILHCSNDYVWLQAKKRMKYRRAKRRRGGNRTIASCAPAMLTIPRMIQHQPNAVEKVEAIGYVSSVDEKHSLNGMAASQSSLNNISLSSNISSSSDSTCGSSSTSNNSSLNSTDHSKVNSNQKVRRSPKPKENDSDIVKKLLANLPAKRNSRETNSPNSTQINKRSKVVGRKNFCSATVSVASKSRGHGTKLSSLPMGESVVTQPTPDNTAPVHNGNDNNSNKSLSTSSISTTTREIISHSTAATKLRTRQGLSSSSTRAVHVSSNKAPKTSFKKTSPSSENTVSDANYKRSSKESVLISDKGPEIRKKDNIKRGKLVGTINKNKMLMWKKGQKRQLVGVTTTNGHHRMLRSSGKRLLPLSVSIRQPSLSLRSIRLSTRGKNVLNKRKVLKKHKPLPPVAIFPSETLVEKESTTMVAKEDTNNAATVMTCDGSSGSIPSNKIDSFLEVVTLAKVKAVNLAESERAEPSSEATDMEQTVDNMQPLVRSRNTSTLVDFPHSATQVTPNQPIKKQYSKDPPATPTKCDPTQAENVQQSLSSYSGVAEPNELMGISGGQSGNCKPRKKKLNDCIAMLTGKLSQQLGVDFFNNEKKIEEVSPNEASASSCSTSEPEKLVTKNTTASSCSVSSDECSSFIKRKEVVLMKEQNVPTHSLLPAVAPNNNSNTSSSVQGDTLASSTLSVWAHENRQDLTALPPQTAPIRLKTVNSVQSLSPNLATPLTFDRLTTQLELATEQILDEPLNLSLNSPIGRGVIRNRKVQWKQDNACSFVYKSLHSQQESTISANSATTQPVHAHRLQGENIVTHFNHLLGSSTHTNHQKVRKPKCTSPPMTDSGSTIASKMGAGNLSSLKLPPGLIIERVEYKQSRPSITKEVPSVTIVARQRQLPVPDLIPSISENSATDLTIEKPTPLMHSSNLMAFPSNSSNFVRPLTNSTSGLHSDANHAKILGYGTYSEPNVLTRRSEPTTDNVVPMLPSVLRTGPCAENRISVTITESNSTVHERMQDVQNPSVSVDLSTTSKNDKTVSSYCSPLPKSPLDSVQIRPPQRTSASVMPASLHKTSIGATGHTPGSSEKTPPPMTTLIIPQVPMPPLSSQGMHPIKRARRKSVFVPLPVPTDESNRDVMAKPLRQQHPIIPTIAAPPSTLPVTTGITSANLLASMSLSFIAPGLLPVPGTSMLGPIDMQRLAAVRLPAHLQPPVIPPLKIPDAATSATLLEKIFHPTHSDALSTGLELKTDAHCNQAKQPPSLQPAAVRSHLYHNTTEENAQFISSRTAKPPTINGFVNQSEQIASKINAPPPGIRIDGIRTTDTKIMKSNNSSAASKPSGRIMKRRASVADLQRKALMEQIWNQSIIDKMMHEKDARIVAGLEETPKAVETTTPTAETAIEKSSNIEIVNEPTTAHKGEHLAAISEGPRVHSSVSICATDGNKAERQHKNECLLEIDPMSTETSENISKTLVLHQNVEEHNTVAVALNVQGEIEAKLQNTQNENNVQLQNKPEDSTIPLMHTVDKTNDSNTTIGEGHCVQEIDPSTSLLTIDNADTIKTVDKVDAASEDGSVDTADCQVNVDTQKPPSKKIVRKRRKNELASILSDQLLESFKEVDKSRLDDLKLLHDLTCETPDVKFTLEQIPQLAKRKSNPRLPELVMQETSKAATSPNITTKKVQNSKRHAKEKELTAQPTAKEVKNKPSFDSGEPSPSEVKGVQVQERKEHGIVNSINDTKDNCALQKHASEMKESAEDLGNTPEQGLANHKATRSKTQTTFSGEHVSHNAQRKTLTRATNSEVNPDVVANDRTADITIPDRKSLLRKLTTTPAAEILQSCEKHNITNKMDDAETANSLPGSNNRLTETMSHKNMDTTPTPPFIVAKAESNPPKRIISRRKSVFVDCDLAQYVEQEEEKLKKASTNVSFKDDFMLTPRRGTRSQGQLGLDLVESLVKATMKPRDPRRRLLQKREEELSARENKLQLQIKNDPPILVEEQTDQVVEKQTKSAGSNSVAVKDKQLITNVADSLVDTNVKNDKDTLFSIGTQEHAPLRRISARRASLCVRPLPDSKNVKGYPGTMAALPEDDHLRDIGNEVKRIYKRRASIYQPTPELQQEDKNAGGEKQINRKESQSLNVKPEEENIFLGKKKETTAQKSHNRRSKTPGPGDWKRRNQLPLNGTSEPLIESLLLHAPDSESNAPKRRTTKNSQIAETVSKLFNIQEEIMLIDSSRRKPRKVNLPSVSTQPELFVQEQQKETLAGTNEDTGIEKGNETGKALSSYELPLVGNEVSEKKSPPHMPRKSFSFSNDEDESPKAIKKLVENIINNTTNSSNASTDYSDDDNMSLACFAARNNAPVATLGQSTDLFAKPPSSTPVRAMSVIADDESTTNTDALDDDMMSVTTEIPPSSNASRMGTRRVRRKRRKSRRQNSKIKRQQTKTQEDNDKPVQSFNCNLCRKMFKKLDAYNKHRMTLSHIAKLSEQEYLVSQQNQERRENESLHVPNENIQLQPKPDDNRRTEKRDEPNANSMDAGPELLPITPDGNLAMASLQMKMTDNNKLHDNQSVKELSQEEKLFFECCSMLKESNSGENDELKRVTVSLKANELVTSTNSISPCVVLPGKSTNVSAADASVHLPLVEQNQTNPASTTCCVEEFVATQVTNIHQQEQEVTSPQNHEVLHEAANFMVQRYVVAKVSSPHNSIKSSSTMPTATTSKSISSSSSSSSSNSSNSSTSSSSDSNTVSKNNAHNAKIKTKGALKGYDNFKVSIPMTGLTVMSTNTASTVVTVGKESRLDTLADVALCGDIPKEFGIGVQSHEINAATLVRVEERVSTCQETVARFPVADTDMFIDGKKHVHGVKLLENNEKDCNAETNTNSSISRASEQSNAKFMTSNKIGCVKNRECSTKSQNKPSTRWITGGPYRRRTERNNPPANAEAALQCDHAFPYEGDDVYAFQDSPCDGDLPATYSSKKNSNTMHNQGMTKNEESSQQQHIKQNTTVTTALEEHDDSQMSSLSFSDRDDFVYGTNTMSEEEEEEEDKNSSISSEQTTPKKLTNADVQKKSLIMGRIFKKGGAKDKFVGDAGVRKSSTTSPETPVAEVPQKAAGMSVVVSKPATTLKSTVKDFDKLFDTLKNDAVSANELQNNNEAESDVRHAAFPAEEILVATMGVKDKLADYQANNSDHPYHPGPKDFGTINTGTDRLRRRRAGQQKILTETWDSDEFEDFQTDDIMRLIDRTEDDTVIDNTLSKKKMPVHRTTDEKAKSGNLECISTDSMKQSSSLNDISNNENHRIDQMLDKHAGSKKGIHSLFDKKPLKSDNTTVTDDTIRKVMESVILETMGKNSSNKRKPTAAFAPTLGTDSSAATNSKALRLSSNSDGQGIISLAPTVSTEDVSLALELTSLEEHTLESSVVISSKTITSKFKQKLSSSMRYNLPELESASDRNVKEPMSIQSKLATNTTSISDTNSGTNTKLVTTSSKNNNNNKNINNNNNNKLSVKSSKPVTGTKNKVKPKCTEEDWIGKTPVSSGKQRKVATKKMKNIAYDPDSDYEQSIKCKKVKRKLLENDIEANLQIEHLQSTLLNAEDSSILLTTPRRKRNAGDMLYYWSSSSDEEIEKEEKTGRTKRHGDITKDRRRHCKPINNNNVPVGKKRGRKKKQTQLASMNSVELTTDDAKKQDASESEKDETKSKSTSLGQPTTVTTETSLTVLSAKKSRTNTSATDKKVGIVPKTKKQLDMEKSVQLQTLPVQTEEETCGTSSEHLQQHGWIMGDSHKKLVTMLAHAKGKHDSRKQSTSNRKK
ncbi:uncharacterized protein LOC128305650 [Anopheles moucheti]|uniref:uncharacterized protein LOC128305650 n=1 Tax=Anopheles moucheti TaxID=186751 RepID=UPI0022F029BC|nr:uncharacterized protein LOC128305650 [Anopheles moucheti]